MMKSGMTKNRDLLIFAIMIAFAIVIPAAIYPVFLMKVLCFALFALAFNLLIGYVGLLSFGHAMFFGFSADLSAYTVTAGGWPTEAGGLAGPAVAALPGLLAGRTTLRRLRLYRGLVT